MELELLEPSFFYHFFNRGNNKENIFVEKENYYYFLSLIEKHLIPIVDIYTYCLLPNHFHFVIKIKEAEALPVKIQIGETKLSQPFSNLFNAYTKAFNKKHHRTGSLFQKHPKRIKIDSDEYLQQLIVYVNTNPSHHHMADYEQYKFSSYQALISDKPTLIKRKAVIDLFDTVENLKYMHEIKKVDLMLLKDLE